MQLNVGAEEPVLPFDVGDAFRSLADHRQPSSLFSEMIAPDALMAHLNA